MSDPDPASPGADPTQAIDALWDYHDAAASEARFRAHLQALAAADAAAAPGSAAEWQTMTQLARALGLQRRFDEARRILGEVERAISGAGHLTEAQRSMVRVRLLLEQGRVLNSSGQPALARQPFEQAWALAREAGLDALAVDAAHMRAIAAADAAESQVWNQRALDLAEQSTQPGARRWRASLLNNIGWTLHDRSDFAAALERFDRALALRQEQGDGREVRIARWCVARTLRSLGRLDEALSIQRANLGEIERQSAAPDGYVHEEIGECLLALGRASEARPHFQLAHAALSQDRWLAEREPARLERLLRLAIPIVR